MTAEDNREQIEAAEAASEVQTVEKTAEYQAALEHEKEGYQARLKQLSDGKTDLQSVERLNELVAGVDAELARIGGQAKKSAKSRQQRPRNASQKRAS